MAKVKTYFFYLTIFITGAVILVIEILGTRVIAPFFGSTIFVWSSLISIALGFLALGYWIGGLIADKRPDYTIFYGIIFLAGIFTSIITKIDQPVLIFADQFGLRLGPLVAALILFSLPLFLLGMITPFAIRLRARILDKVGGTSGSIFSFATVGSLVGALLSGFYLIPNFGIDSILNFTAFTLFSLSIVWVILNRKYFGLFLALIFLPLFFIFTYKVDRPELTKLLYQTNDFYGEIKVLDVPGDIRCLVLDGIAQTCINRKTGKSVFTCTRHMSAARLLNPEAKQVLVIGAAGGALSKELASYSISVDVVEISPKMVKVAEEYFDFKESDLIHIFIQDGRHFIQNSDKKYDIILLDAFSASAPVAHLLTKEAFQAMDKLITPEGILVVNTLGWAKGNKTALQKAVYKTLEEIFPYVYVVAKGSRDEIENVEFFAAKQKLDTRPIISQVPNILEIEFDNRTPILTDNYNPVEFLSIPSQEALRELAKESYGKVMLID